MAKVKRYTFPDVYVDKVKKTSFSISYAGPYIGGFVGNAGTGSPNTVRLISSWNEYTQIYNAKLDSPFMTDAYLAYAVYGFFQNGGSSCYVLNSQDITTEEVLAKAKISTMTLALTSDYNTEEEGGASCKIKSGKLYLKFGDTEVYVGAFSSDFTSKTAGNQLIEVRQLIQSGEARSMVTVVSISAAITDITTETTVEFSGGTLPVGEYLEPTAETYALFDDITDIAMLSNTETATQAANQLLLDYCTNREDSDIHAILGVESPAVSDTTVNEMADRLVGNGNLYYPWGIINDPLTGAEMYIPNVGHVQGMIVRTAEEIGKHKVPAGVKSVIRGFIGLATYLGKKSAGDLNDNNVCCLLDKKNYGIVCWGGRSLAAEPDTGRYISSFLLETYIARDLYNGLQRFVFEPNVPATWQTISDLITRYMTGLFDEGCFDGSTTSEAFIVQCDANCNTAETIAARKLIARVAYREKGCAEFIIIELSHDMEVA